MKILRAGLPSEPEKIWTAVFISLVAGLVRFGRSGMVLTDSGRAVCARLNDAPITGEPRPIRALNSKASAVSHGFASLRGTAKPDSRGSSHRKLVRDALRPPITDLAPDRLRATPSVEIGQLRTPHTPATDSLPTRGGGMGSGEAPAVSITAADHRELSASIAAARKLAVLSRETRPLQDKLAQAAITPAVPAARDLITMNTLARVVDLETDERLELLLVYPAEADLTAGRISVFHPLGAAMLGHRVGDVFEWHVPYGWRRFKVEAVRFQPEAALAIAA